MGTNMESVSRQPRTEWQRIRRELFRNRSAVVGMIVLAVFVALGLLAPVIAPFSPIVMHTEVPFAPPSLEPVELGRTAEGRAVRMGPFLMGTDQYGRDVFSRVLHGSTVSLQVAIICNAIGLFFGTTLGLVSGYAGGRVDFAMQRLIDMLYAFPSVLLAIAVIAVLGPGLYNVMFAIGFSWIPVYTRLVRGCVMSTKQHVYVEAARCVGASTSRIVTRHILPNIASSIIILGSVNMGTAILTAAALSFIGLGVQRPDPEWGVMLNEGRAFMVQAPWLTIFPGLAIALSVLSVNMFGDGLRGALDPRMRIE